MRRAVIALTATLCVGLAPGAEAQTDSQGGAATPLTGLYECANVADAAARLQCFDQAVSSLRTAESAGDVVAVDRGQVATLERESFGFRLPSFTNILARDGDTGGERIERVEARVERVLSHRDGRHTFVLNNGQSWIQLESRSASNVDPGDDIAIRRASVGSFMLSPVSGAAHRVRRVQ